MLEKSGAGDGGRQNTSVSRYGDLTGVLGKAEKIGTNGILTATMQD